MKLLAILFTMAIAAEASAAKLEAIECKKEMMATALSYLAQQVTLETLESNTFEITDFDYATAKGWEYSVFILTGNRSEHETGKYKINVKTKMIGKCRIAAQLEFI